MTRMLRYYSKGTLLCHIAAREEGIMVCIVSSASVYEYYTTC